MTIPGTALLIRADASSSIGSGHVMRCLALAKAWQSAGGTVSCVSAETIPELEERLIQGGVAFRKIYAAPGTKDDADATVAEARFTNAAWFVVDGYRFEPAYIKSLKSAGTKVLFLDDDGRFDFYPADVVLNQNISASAAMYGNRDSFTQLLLGSQYALLRPEFMAESQARGFPAVARQVLVTMGGSDSGDMTRKALIALSKIREAFETTVVLGSGYSQLSELQTLVKQLSMQIKVERNLANMSAVMRWADVAISGAGGTCWELAYMGVPSIVIALSRDQQAIARGLAENEIAVSLGWHANLSEERIGDVLLSLMSDRDRRVAMSERGQKLVDGRGAERVVTFLKNFL